MVVSFPRRRNCRRGSHGRFSKQPYNCTEDCYSFILARDECGARKFLPYGDSKGNLSLIRSVLLDPIIAGREATYARKIKLEQRWGTPD